MKTHKDFGVFLQRRQTCFELFKENKTEKIQPKKSQQTKEKEENLIDTYTHIVVVYNAQFSFYFFFFLSLSSITNNIGKKKKKWKIGMMTMDTMRADKQPLYNYIMLSMHHYFAMFENLLQLKRD